MTNSISMEYLRLAGSSAFAEKMMQKSLLARIAEGISLNDLATRAFLFREPTAMAKAHLAGMKAVSRRRYREESSRLEVRWSGPAGGVHLAYSHTMIPNECKLVVLAHLERGETLPPGFRMLNSRKPGRAVVEISGIRYSLRAAA